MRIIIQRVSEASVSVDNKIIDSIKAGMMILVGVENGDTEDDCRWLAAKTSTLRIFDDENGVMNRSIIDVGGEILAISQFTLTASTRKGNRPSYIRAAAHPLATHLYEMYISETSQLLGKQTHKGIFGADMKISLINDGPVTIMIDSKLRE